MVPGGVKPPGFGRCVSQRISHSKTGLWQWPLGGTVVPSVVPSVVPFAGGARLCRLMGLLASLRSDDSDQGVSFDTLVGTLVETSEGGFAPPCGSIF